jgi:uncharacterized membrane protein
MEIAADKQDIEQNKDIAAFSYLWIMSVVVFFLRRKSPFVRFHAKQAMVLFGLSLLVLLIPILNRLLELFILGLMGYGFLNAAQGLQKDIPIVGPLSRREMTIREAWKALVERIAKIMSMFRSKTKPPSPTKPSVIELPPIKDNDKPLS